jgi:hypothetical protein
LWRHRHRHRRAHRRCRHLQPSRASSGVSCHLHLTPVSDSTKGFSMVLCSLAKDTGVAVLSMCKAAALRKLVACLQPIYNAKLLDKRWPGVMQAWVLYHGRCAAVLEMPDHFFDIKHLGSCPQRSFTLDLTISHCTTATARQRLTWHPYCIVVLLFLNSQIGQPLPAPPPPLKPPPLPLLLRDPDGKPSHVERKGFSGMGHAHSCP